MPEVLVVAGACGVGSTVDDMLRDDATAAAASYRGEACAVTRGHRDRVPAHVDPVEEMGRWAA